MFLTAKLSNAELKLQPNKNKSELVMLNRSFVAFFELILDETEVSFQSISIKSDKTWNFANNC